ncbi:metallophosphoesterase [Vibrio cholerae]|nr:metallophosphoesterase [Vibrio cholerae]
MQSHWYICKCLAYMKIIIISDLHVGDAAVSNEFAVGSSTNAVKNRFLDELRQLAKHEKICADYIVVAGDITNRATKEEFELASRRLKEIATIVGVEQSSVFFVPGNHDGNWSEEEISMTAQENINITIERKYNNLRFNDFFKECLERAHWGCYYKEPYFAIWSDEKLNVIGVNCSAFDHYDKKPHHGVIRKQDLKVLDAKLQELQIANSDKINLMVVHHHPIQQPDLPFDRADHSILQNAAILMEIASKHNVNFIVHGHKHIPRLAQYSDEYLHPINILCAGSFSARLDDRWFQGVPNTIHQIEIDKVCDVNKTPLGRVVSWSHNTGHGWTKDESINGIPHKEFFGNRMSPVELKKQLKESIERFFEIQTHVKWSELSNHCADIIYTSRKLLEKTIVDLSSEIGFTIHRTPGQDELFILLKGN